MMHIYKYLSVVSILFLLSGCKVILHSNLQETEANKVLAVLMVAGIPTKKMVDGGDVSVLVQRSRFGEAVQLLEYHGLPAQQMASIEEMFPADSLVASPIQEWIRYNFARSQEISASIAGMPGVVRADVHIAEQPADGPFEDTIEPKVSVMVQLRRDALTDNFIPQVKSLVSFSIPGLGYEDVSVVLSPVEDLPDNTEGLVSLWGLVLMEDSAMRLRQALNVLGGGLAALLCAIALLSRRRRGAPKGAS